MTAADQHRAHVLTQLSSGLLTAAEAATLLGRSPRQTRRLAAAYLSRGPAAVVHGNRGRTPAHALPAATREQIVQLAQGRYAGFNLQHFTEHLQDDEGLTVSRSSVRRILAAAGLGSPRPQRRRQHRTRRERYPQAGMLLQADASRHRWLGPDLPPLTLIGGIDDATGTVPYALFRPQEDAHGYLLWLRTVVQQHGIPLALYVDRHGIFRLNPSTPPTLDEQLAGTRQPTQVGQVLADLGITPIFAQSPQAKGRIERLWGTFQDRLCSELRLAGASTAAAATAVLEAFLPQFNARFAVPAAQAGSAYRPVPADLVLDTVFCFRYLRVVAADNTVQFAGQRLQLLPGRERPSYARAQVTVQERLDGSVAVYYQGQCLASTPAPAEAPVLRTRARRGVPPPATPPAAPPQATPPPAPPVAKAPWRPAANHPWRR